MPSHEHIHEIDPYWVKVNYTKCFQTENNTKECFEH